MGVRAYDRGTAALQEQIDREQEAARPALDARALRQLNRELRARVADLEADRARAVACIRRMELSRSIERALHEEQIASLAGRLRMALDLWQQADRRWRWVSRLVRALCSPEAVRAWREEQPQ